MAQVTYRGNLSAKVFPFISEYFGATVIIPGPDQNFQRQLTSSEDLDKDRGIPQVLYCHNVMPSAEGFQSVGYTPIITDGNSNFENIFILQDVNGNEVFFSHTQDGNNYVLAYGQSRWTVLNSITTIPNGLVTTATLNGQSYIYFESVGCFIYYNGTLQEVELAGLDKTKVKGITSSSGYMIAWTETSIAWSSTVDHPIPTDPIDFVPSLETGAGGGSVEQAKGKITICVAHYLGFIIYTTDNAVASVYSGNSRFPFNLREIVNSGGVADSALIALDSNSGNHYAYTTSGLQLVSISQTQTVFPEITDFISGSYFEDFDESTLQFVRQPLSGNMAKSLSVVSDRYLIISYGINSLTHAIVYDIVQKRFGKLKLPHALSFEWKELGTGSTIPRKNIGLLQSNGSIKTVDFSYVSNTSYGVMLLGKYQLSRTRTLTLDEVELENIRAGSDFKLYNMVSYDGKTLQPAVLGYLASEFSAGRRYNFKQTGINHTLLALGNFYCSSIVLKFHINGRR
jgi:hypothetical protein